MAAMVNRFTAGAKSVDVEAAWSEKADGTMSVVAQKITVGDNSWVPADKQDKALRALGAGRPVFLDNDLLVLRAQPPYIVWVFARGSG